MKADRITHKTLCLSRILGPNVDPKYDDTGDKGSASGYRYYTGNVVPVKSGVAYVVFKI